MIDKTYFDRIGKYDMLMDIWGGENLGNNYKWEDDYYIKSFHMGKHSLTSI